MAPLRTRNGWLVSAAVIAALPLAVAGAQPPGPSDPGCDVPPGAPHGLRYGPDEAGRGRPGPPGVWQVEHLVRRLFMVSAEDRGPLREGELEELLAFARDELPHLYRVLERARSEDPERFRRRFEEHAPQLRHMKRIFEESPEIGGLLKQHAQNEFQIRRHARRLWRSPKDSALYADALRDIRAVVAENVRIEMRMLTLLEDKFEERMAERVEARLAYLLGDGVDLAVEPEPVRTAVAAYHAALPEERETARQQVAQIAQRQVHRELDAIEERLELLQSQAAEEVDRRVQHLLERLENMPRRGPRHGPGPDRGRRPEPGRGSRPGDEPDGGRGGDPRLDW